MPNYVYGCNADNSHPRQLITHGMLENPTLFCDECGGAMHRIPQPFRFGVCAGAVLVDWMEENWARKKTGRARFSPDEVKRPGKPIPQQQFDTRRYKHADK